MQLTPNIRIILASLGVLIFILTVWFFSTIVWYILISAVLAIVGKPMVKLVRKIKISTQYYIPQWLSAMVTLIIIITVIGGLIMAILPIIIDKVHLISNYSIQDIAQIINQPINNLENTLNNSFPELNISLQKTISDNIAPLLQHDALKNSIGTIANLTMEIVMGVFCVSFITYFFLKDENMFKEWICAFFPTKYEENVSRAIKNSTQLIIRYFIGISIESLIKLVFITIALYLIGLPFDLALIIALITAVLNVIPYVGPIIGAVVGMIIGLLNPMPEMTMLSMMMQMSMTFLIFQLLDNIIIQPYIYASSVKAHPLEIFIVILMAGYIYGVVGMLLAIPTYTVLRVFAKEFFSNFKLVKRLTDNI